jgi:Domain of unknown function (DUF4440)
MMEDILIATLIATLEENLRQAMRHSDVAALDELIADDLVFTMHTGLMFTKQDDLEARRTGTEKLTQVDTDELSLFHHLSRVK